MADPIKIPVELVDKFSKQFSEVEKRIGGVEKSLDTLNKRAVSATSGFDGLKTAFTAVFGAVSAGSVIAFLKESVSAFSEQENAVKKLEVALRNQGITSKEVSKQIQDYATSIQKTTTFSDELVIESQALLVSFGLVGDKLNQTTKAALDLSIGMGIDLVTATKLLGKAAAGETETLSRFGIKISENAKESEKLDLVIEAISKRFGGQATAATETFSGKLAQLKNQVGELQESLGGALVPDLLKLTEQLNIAAQQTPAFVAGLKSIGKEIEESKLTQLAQTLQKDGVISLLKQQADLTGEALQKIASFVRDIGLADTEVTANHAANTAQQVANIEIRKQQTEQELAAKQTALQIIADLEAQNSNNRLLQFELEQQKKLQAFQKEIKDEELLSKFKQAQAIQLLKFREKEAKEQVKLKQAETKAKIQLEIDNATAAVNLASQVFSKNKELAIASIAIAKAIAIANTLKSYAALGLPGKALAIAQVALLTVQFAQQASAVTGTNLSKGGLTLPSTEQPSLNFPTSGGIGPASFGGGGTSGFNQTVNITITEVDLGDPSKRKQVINGINEELQAATAEAIKMAKLSSELSVQNAGASA